MKKVLITGGAGFIGSNLALKLVSKGYEVSVLDNLSVQIHGKDPGLTSPLFQSISGKVNFIKGDVRNYDDWMQCISNQEVIVHLAAETGTGQSMYEMSRYVQQNANGTAKLLELVSKLEHKPRRMILSSSRAVYGDGAYTDGKEIYYSRGRRVEAPGPCPLVRVGRVCRG